MNRMKAVLTLAAAIMFAISPWFSSGFGGFDANRFPVPQVDPPITPAGYAFAIWGLIYAWLIVHAGFGLLKRDTDADWDRVRWPLIISTGIGASWIEVAVNSPAWATVLIWVMLISALFALFRASRTKDWWLLQMPLAIYAGWLSAASFVSIGLVAAGYGFVDEASMAGWIALALALLFTGAVQIMLGRAPAYGLTVAWALIAITVRNWESDNSFAMVAAGGAVIMAGLALRSMRTGQTAKAG